jgi:hypothetical protein
MDRQHQVLKDRQDQQVHHSKVVQVQKDQVVMVEMPHYQDLQDLKVLKETKVLLPV